MKIIHIITRLINGGADENTVYTCNWFAERGDEVIIVIGGETDDEMLSRLDDRVRVIAVPELGRAIRLETDLKSVIAIRKLIARERPDIIHTHTSKAGIVGRLAAVGPRRPIVIHGIHILPFLNVSPIKAATYRRIELLAARCTDAFISVSESMKDVAIANGIGRLDQHFVAPSGMPIASFLPARKGERDWSEPLRVIYLANLEPRKQHLQLLQAVLARRSELHGKVTFRFCGRGYMFEQLAAFIRENGLSDMVELAGFTSDPAAAIAGADVGIYVSRNEGLPRAIVQYFASGKPVVAMRLPGIDRLVVDGETGRMIEQDDFDGLLDALAAVAVDPELDGRLRRNARKVDVSPWSIENMCERINDVYEKVLRTRRTELIAAE